MVVILAPERLLRLKVDPFQNNKAMLHEWPCFDDDGGIAWAASHVAAVARLKALAEQLTVPTSILTLQSACVLTAAAESAGEGLPINEHCLAPYVGRLIAKQLPDAARPLLTGCAGRCPFCNRCLADQAAEGEVVLQDVAFCNSSQTPQLTLRDASGATLPLGTDSNVGTPSAWQRTLDQSLREYASSSVVEELRRRACTWVARSVEQAFPMLRRGEGGAHSSVCGGLFQSWEGVGRHELFIESPRHNVAFGSGMSVGEVYAVVQLWASRYQALATSGSAAVGVLFKNHGAEAGGTQHHCHSQLVGLPVVPTSLAALYSRARMYHEMHGECCCCAIARVLRGSRFSRVAHVPGAPAGAMPGAAAVSAGPGAPPVGLGDFGPELVVFENEHFVSFVPWAPSTDYCVWIMPWEHRADLLRSEAAESVDIMMAFAECLREVLRRLYWQCGNPDHNLFVRSPTFTESSSVSFHWYVEVSPKFTKLGGLEVATQTAVLLNRPQDVARKLRDVKVPSGKVRRGSTMVYTE